MAAEPTVIARFVAEVVEDLRRRGAPGAARHVWDAAAMFEPSDRVLRREAEYQRLLLLADRAARRWIPTLVRALGDERLNELARQQSRVRTPDDAASDAQLVGGLRDELRRMPRGIRAVQPNSVAAALVPLQQLLQQVARTRRDEPHHVAITAVPHAAQGLVACFFEGAAFEDGIQGEARSTVAVLDALDDERTSSWGVRASERTAHESDLHRTLVRLLMSNLALQVGTITHADDTGALPQPLVVGRHRPDLAGRTADGALFLGEAKLGPELFETHTQEQFQDFLSLGDEDSPVVLYLTVPAGWRAEAERAAHVAAGSTHNLVIRTLEGLVGAPPPPISD